MHSTNDRVYVLHIVIEEKNEPTVFRGSTKEKPSAVWALLRWDFIRNALTDEHARAHIRKLSPGGPH